MIPTRNVTAAARHGQSDVQVPFTMYTVAFIANMSHILK